MTFRKDILTGLIAALALLLLLGEQLRDKNSGNGPTSYYSQF